MNIAFLSMLAAAVTLPVGNVDEVRDVHSRTCPARVVSISEVAVTPQVTGEILEVGFVNGQQVEIRCLPAIPGVGDESPLQGRSAHRRGRRPSWTGHFPCRSP